MFDLENILSCFNLTKQHIDIIKSHDWIDNRYGEIIEDFESIYCAKCDIGFAYVLYKHQSSNGTKWHKLTCNEVLIKKLLE